MTTQPIADQGRRVLLSAGTCWYIWNFRRRMVDALVAAGWDVLVMAPEDEHTAHLIAIPGVTWVNWQLSLFGTGKLAELKSLAAAIRTVRKQQPNFVINHSIKPNIYLGAICRVLGIPYANNVTGLGMKITEGGRVSRALAIVYASACNGARRVFVQNADDLALLRTAGLRYRVPVTRTIGSGVDLGAFAPVPMPPLDEGISFIFMGRLQLDKGIQDFVEAARALRADGSRARFSVIGSNRHANRESVSDATLKSWAEERLITFRGHCDDVRPAIAAAHVLVMPSHGGEGVPKVMLEAAAIGRPIIASNVAGCRDVVLPERTGILHRPQDVQALKEAMRRFEQMKPEELVEMSCAIRADAEARFSDRQLIEATLALVNGTENPVDGTSK